MTLLHVIRTGNGRSSMPQTMLKAAINPPGVLGTRGTGPQKVTGALPLLNLMITASIRVLLLTTIAWPRNHRPCVCLRRCWMRFFDLRMLRLCLLRISLVFKHRSVSSRIARVKRPTSTNRYVLLGAPESIGVADPNLPASQPCSSTNKEKPIFELGAE